MQPGVSKDALGLSLEERQALQQAAIDENDEKWLEELRAQRRAEGEAYLREAEAKLGIDPEEFAAMGSNVERIEWVKHDPSKVVSEKEYQKLQEYAESKGIKFDYGKRTNIDTNLVREMIDISDEMLQKFPELRGENKTQFTLRLSSLHNDTFGEVGRHRPHILHINEAAMRNATVLAEEYKKLADAGHFVKGTTYRSIPYHEIGHMYERHHGINPLEVVQKMLNIAVDEAIIRLKSDLSIYSTVSSISGSQITAEIFSAYYGGTENELALTFLDFLGII